MRHSIDAEEEATYQHDAKLTKKGKRKCQSKAASLIRKHGIPSVIVVSPFERTRETAEQFQRYIRKYHRIHVKIIIERDLGRYFTDSQRKNPDMRSRTKAYGVIMDGSEEKLEERVKKHAIKVLKKGYHTRSEIVWCITHGIIVKKLFRAIGESPPEHVAFLEEFVIPPTVSLPSLQ